MPKRDYILLRLRDSDLEELGVDTSKVSDDLLDDIKNTLADGLRDEFNHYLKGALDFYEVPRS